MNTMYAAVARHGREDNRSPWYPEQAVSIQAALWAYTMGAAMATGEQDANGSLAPGKVADMVGVKMGGEIGRDVFEAEAVVAAVPRVLVAAVILHPEYGAAQHRGIF